MLRPAVDADRDAIARIWFDGWMSNGIALIEQPTRAALRTRVDDDFASGWCVTVAERSGAVVGFVALRPDQNKLDQLFVAPDHHNTGVGKALFAASRAAMPTGFSLWAHGENGRAKRFYDALMPKKQAPGSHPKHGHPIITYWY